MTHIPAIAGGGGGSGVTLDTAQTITGEKTFDTAAGNELHIHANGGDSARDVNIWHDGDWTRIYSWDGCKFSDRWGNCATFSGVGSSFSIVCAGAYYGAGAASTGFTNYFGNCFGIADTSDTNQAKLRHAENSAPGFSMSHPLYFDQVADVGTPANNKAGLGAEDVAGTAELVATDEAGTETQLTSHRSDGPDWLYDDVNETGMLDKIEYHAQKRLGVIDWWNVSRERRLRLRKIDLVEYSPDLTPGQLQHCCGLIETFAAYNARTGKAKTVRTWEEDQQRAKATRDREVSNALQTAAANDAEYAERLAAADAEHTKALAEHAKLPPAEREKAPAPVKRDVPKPAEIDVPAEYTPKPKPEWLARWEEVQRAK